MICFQRTERGKGKIVTLQCRNLAKRLHQVIKINISSDVLFILTHVMGRTFHLCGVLSKTYNPSLIIRKTSAKPKLRATLQNTWPILLKTVNVMKNKERRRNCHNKRLGRPDNGVQCGILDWILNQKEDIHGKIGEIVMCQCQFFQF